MAILDVEGTGVYAAILLAVHWERASGMHIIHLPSIDICVWPGSSRLLFYICLLCYLLTHCYASVFIICLYYVWNLLLSDWLKPIYCSLLLARQDLSLPLSFKRLLGRKLGGWGRALGNFFFFALQTVLRSSFSKEIYFRVNNHYLFLPRLSNGTIFVTNMNRLYVECT